MTILERSQLLRNLDNTLKNQFEEKINLFKSKLEEDLKIKEEEINQPRNGNK